MIGAADLEGRLVVTLGVARGVVARVAIRSTRLVGACRVLEGKPPAKVLDLLPRLFAVCGTAQQAAGELACARALGLDDPPARGQARRRRVLAETAIEHGTRLLMEWPTLVGEPPQAVAARAFRAALAPVRAGAPVRPELAGAVVAALADVLGAFNPAGGVGAFRAWVRAGACPAARLFDRLHREGLAGYGAGDVPLMAGLDETWIETRLAADADGAFVAQPNAGHRRVFETGPLARWHDHPLLADLVAGHGPGLVARLVARLIEMAAALDALTAETAEAGAAEAGTESAPSGSGSGLGVVEAARGRLIHRVEIADGLVRRYQILAPTEWNFHPQGPLVRGLTGDRADDGLAARARLLIGALDPCVACDIEIT